MIPNHYQTLLISPTASKDEIKRSYRQLALKFHPDRNKSPNAHDKFILINEAYFILYDDEARTKYDKEFEYTFGQKIKVNQESFSYSEKIYDDKESKDTFSSKKESGFEDEDLNRWTKNAREQAENFAKIAYTEFSKLVAGMVKETGFQLWNACLVLTGLFISIGGCGDIVVGLTSKGEMGNPILGIIILPIGIFLLHLALKNYNKHKNM